MKTATSRKIEARGGAAETAAKAVAGPAGYSLIEMMVGVCILSIGILAVCSMQVAGLKGNAASYQQTDYVTLAMEHMETLMAMPYDSLPADADNNDDAGFFVTDDTADQVTSDPDGKYTIYTNVASDYLVQDTTSVSIIVVWQSGVMRRSVSIQGVVPRII